MQTIFKRNNSFLGWFKKLFAEFLASWQQSLHVEQAMQVV
jgi:hypothetical protein